MAQRTIRNIASVAKEATKLDLNLSNPTPLPRIRARCVHLTPSQMSEEFFFDTFMKHGRRPQVAHAPAFSLYIKEVPKLARWLRPAQIPLHVGPECLTGRHKLGGLFPQAQVWHKAPPEVRVLLHRPKRLLGKLAVHRFKAGKRVFAAIKWNVKVNNLWKGITIDTKQVLFAIPTVHALEQPMSSMIADAETALKQLGISVGRPEAKGKWRKGTTQTHEEQREDRGRARPFGSWEVISKREDASTKAKTQARQGHTSTAADDQKS
ncbi:hypothetical protein BCV69DRAFT_301228 [Microstroma glucosiphilum]|uniref:Uncharacterized protein n=1 Tax=Pseudomicrostroma glucosiphilum TaxID=1684307 RepID=A0A316TZ87_9BASI|nr:hypothetical protein BCV69DRAFT_301228 [Pseudomicrostroma glucosiphilum]PWN18427.1 hypothetical protein BCV69DRAFT_301228 [Pseudomicrostroma glucosiphilum]